MNNKGVNCDVCSCMHNLNGVECTLDRIQVSDCNCEGKHFCKSFKCDPQYKEDCKCGCRD